MIAIIKRDNEYEELINTEHILYSFKRDQGYGLVMSDKREIWLSWKEFEELKKAITKEKQ